MMGIPFSPKAMLIRMAKFAGLTWFEEVFYDPEFQMILSQQLAMGPQAGASKGQPAPQGGGGGFGGASMNEIAQNGQPGAVMGGGESPVTETRRQAQVGANQAQREVSGTY